MDEKLDIDEMRAEVVEHGVLDYDQAQELLSRLEQAEQAVQRVRELHERIPVVVNGRWEIDHCKFCYEQDFSSDDAVWPCPTIRALDGGTRG